MKDHFTKVQDVIKNFKSIFVCLKKIVAISTIISRGWAEIFDGVTK